MGIRGILRPLLAAILAVPALLSSGPSMALDGEFAGALMRQLPPGDAGARHLFAPPTDPAGGSATLHEVRVPWSGELLHAARLVPPAAPIRVGARGGVEPSDAPPPLAHPVGLQTPPATRRGDPYQPRARAFVATGGWPPYFPTAPPLHG